jgi:RIO kinase 2
MYLSRLAAEKEWAFLQALHRHTFPVPRPVDWNRHCVVMGAVDGRVLDQLHLEDWDTENGPDIITIAQYLYEVLMRLLVRIAEHGLIHGDFNEFNLMIKESFIASPNDFINRPLTDDPDQSAVVMIDFPQMVSTSHVNAAELFDRDVSCLRLFFKRRFGFEPAEWPEFTRDVQLGEERRLDGELKASGFRNIDGNCNESEDPELEDLENSESESESKSESESEELEPEELSSLDNK